MIGNEYWATGIVVTYWRDEPAWSGLLSFHDDGFANDSVAEGRISTEGTLKTRYLVKSDDSDATLTAVIDVLIRDAAKLGIEWRYKHLYYTGDGQSEDWPPPKGWREMLAAQCARLGWEDAYPLSSGKVDPADGV